jgi:transcriptional regulator with XRE-family HTH domain
MFLMSAQADVSVLSLSYQPRSGGRSRMTSAERVDALRRAIRHLLDIQNLTPTGLANRIGMSHSVVNRFLTGQSTVILPRTLRRIAKVLGVRTHELRRYRVGGNTNELVQEPRLPNFHDRVRERIADVILHRGLTVYSLAKRAKVTPPTLYNFMSGKTNSLRNSTLNCIAKTLGLPASFFLKSELTEKERASLSVCNSPFRDGEEEMAATEVSTISEVNPKVHEEDVTLRLLKEGLPPIRGELRVIRAPNSFETIRRGDILLVDTQGDIIHNSLVLTKTGNGALVLRRSNVGSQNAMLVVGYVMVA